MKRLFILLLVFACSACNNWLNISPESSVTYTNFFQTEDDLQALHLSMLTRLKKVCMGKQPYYYISIDADEVKANIEGFRALDVAIHTTQLSYGNILESSWRDHYAVISLADLMLDNEYRFGNIPADRIAFWLKQTHFIKALAYFRIAQIWGDAPISPGSESLVALAKSPALEVLGKAVVEAEAALGLPSHNQMTDANGQTITSKQYASRGSANTLLAHIYAWMGGLTGERKYWEQAEYYASQVIDEFAGDYELEDMEGLIANVFGKNRNSKETIFCIDNDLADDGHIYDSRFKAELPGQELVDYPHTKVSPQSLSTDRGHQYNRIAVETVKELYPEASDLRRRYFWYNLGHVSYRTIDETTQDSVTRMSPYAFIDKWRDYHYQTNQEILEGGGLWQLQPIVIM